MKRIAIQACASLIVCLSLTAMGQAQEPVRHYLYDSTMPPGMIGAHKALMRPQLVGYLQPVQVIAPDEARVSVFSQGAFQSAQQPINLGLMVGSVYRFKITHIPGHPGREVFPSIEIINRLYPPEDKRNLFPVPIHIPIEDLRPVMDGKLVTRVIYLENPETAIPEQQRPGTQPYIDVGLSEDPVRVAENFGRPMAIVRIGSRIPDMDELNGFGFGSPTVEFIQQPPMEEEAQKPELNLQGNLHNQPVIQQVAYVQEDQSATTTTLTDQSQATIGNPVPAKPASTGLTTKQLFKLFDESCQTCPNACACESIPLQFPYHGAAPRDLKWRDEIICDGGDRNFKAIVGRDWEIRGLDAEDTIGHFDTLDGRRIVDESNRVCIYAPRFAAVRKIDGLGTTQYNQAVTRLHDKTGTESSRRSDFSSTTLQNLAPNLHKSANSAHGLENKMRGYGMDNKLVLQGLDSELKSFEQFRLIKHGFVDNREKGRLAIAMDRARSWQNNLEAQATQKNLKLIIVNDFKSAQETVHVKTEKGRPQLRIVKIASTDMARPGDEVEFTLRFDNVGTEVIGNVTIIDKLTTRLEFIEGTAECSITAEFTAEPNDAHSETLRWEITDPLEPTKGGIIRFKCRVR